MPADCNPQDEQREEEIMPQSISSASRLSLISMANKNLGVMLIPQQVDVYFLLQRW